MQADPKTRKADVGKIPSFQLERIFFLISQTRTCQKGEAICQNACKMQPHFAGVLINNLGFLSDHTH